MNISGQSPVKVKLIGVTPGGAADEKAVHDLLTERGLHSHGEWFHFDPVILTFFDKVKR